MAEDKKPDEQEPQSLSPLTVLGSVFRAWFGVQSEKNRQRDFSTNDPKPFIVAGVIFAVIMVIGVIIAVNIVLSSAGK